MILAAYCLALAALARARRMVRGDALVALCRDGRCVRAAVSADRDTADGQCLALPSRRHIFGRQPRQGRNHSGQYLFDDHAGVHLCRARTVGHPGRLAAPETISGAAERASATIEPLVWWFRNSLHSRRYFAEGISEPNHTSFI